MGNFEIFGLQFAMTTLVYALAARWYLAPRLAQLTLRDALIPILLLHSLRALGMTVLVTAVVSPDVPREFAVPLAYGDLLTALLALLSIAALRARPAFATSLVWIFNSVGFVDLLNAFYQGIRLDVTRYQLGAAWYIPTYVVPALVVTHIMIFSMLLRRARPTTT